MKILLVGDVMLGRLVNRVLAKKPLEYPWGDTLPTFSEADLRIANLECVISDIGSPWSATLKVFHFRTDSRNVAVLKAAGIDAVTLANNHSLDYGADAMADMIDTLDKKDIGHAGAGFDFNNASRPLFMETGEGPVSLISFTDNEPSWEAGPDKPGIYFVPVDTKDPRAVKLLDLVRFTKDKLNSGGVLIVSAHWGPNWGCHPDRAHPPFARALVDAGADIVFGHSCHIFQGIEIYKGRPVIYSAGDFIDDYAVDPVERNDQSFIFMINIKKGRVKGLDLHPTLIEDFRAVLARGERAADIAGKMASLCREYGTRADWNEVRGVLEINLE